MKKMNFAKLILSSSFLVACGGGAGSDSNVLPRKDPNGPPPASADLGTGKSLNKIPSEVVSSRGSSVENPSLNKGSSVDKANIDVKDLTSTEMDASPKDTENDSNSSDSSPSESRATSESASDSSTTTSDVPSPFPTAVQPKSILKKGDRRKSPDDSRTSPRKRLKNTAERKPSPVSHNRRGGKNALGRNVSAAERAAALARANDLWQAASIETSSPSASESKSTPSSPTPKRLAGNDGAITQRTLRESDAQSGSVDLGEISKHYSLNMPLHIKVSAASSHLETRDKHASLFYRSGNALLGVSHAFTHAQNQFLNHDSQKETSVVAAFLTGPSFLELQAGTMSKHSLHDANWSGSQQILTAGYDCTSGITPFVQLAARQLLENKTTQHQEHSAYAGFLLDAERKNDFYTSKSMIALKTGIVSDRYISTVSTKVEHSLSVEHGLKLDTISFNTSLELSTKDSAQVNMSIGFSL